MNICANCRHCYIDDYNLGLDKYRCKTYVYIGRISGRNIYIKCANVRKGKDDCPLFKEKLTLLKRIINLFKKKSR